MTATWSSFSISISGTTTTAITGTAKRQRSKLVVAVGAATEKTGFGWAGLGWAGLVWFGTAARRLLCTAVGWRTITINLGCNLLKI